KEASGNIVQVAEISRLTPDDFDLYSGNDDMIIPLCSVGGIGAISTVANIAPKDTHDMVMAFLDGDTKKACDMQLGLLPLIDSVFVEVNPVPIKTAVSLMGKNGGDLRPPLYEMDDENLEVLKTEMKNYGLIK
ncbi:MAG: dihydrodipicolinate synthase family protein, partial [Clostridia bacterium]|nr:dihydrodipicolinate synthase family protein [Clostridia bacterium]